MAEKEKQTTEKHETIGGQSEKKVCGIIMPIAEHPEYKVGHWGDVLAILSEALEGTEFEINLVSDDVAIGLIHERIVNNIYSNEIVICDVSSKNPNVMFELGLRLAFDKPTIIIKDEKTGYSFDTSVIEHITYPSDLRFGEIKKFKEVLKKRVIATYKKSQEETGYSPFLKSFGKTIVAASIQQTEVSESSFIISKIDSISKELKLMRLENKSSAPGKGAYRNSAILESLFNDYLVDKKVSEKGKNDLSDNIINVNDFQQYLRGLGADYPIGILKDYINFNHVNFGTVIVS